ncbi:MAG: SDR family oxidoreductase [Flavobacteriales bacterium]|nr:SDR family oxidoreductase [Flavobacteriales bacterium]
MAQGGYVNVVLVTGGSSGLGKAMCERLSALGHRVYGTGRKPEQDPSGYHLLAMDISDSASVEKAVGEILQREGRIDVVVNNAGLGIQGAVEDVDPELALRLFDVNVLGAHRVCRAVLPGMRTRKQGTIVQISSIAANFGLPYRGFYSASKAALDRWTEAMRVELKPFGIRVVTVQPGEFRTRIADSRLRPQRIGEAYLERYEKAMAVLNGSLHYSRDPAELSAVIARIIRDPRPRTIYRVAQGVQKLSVLAKKLLPGHAFERMVAKHYE